MNQLLKILQAVALSSVFLFFSQPGLADSAASTAGKTEEVTKEQESVSVAKSDKEIKPLKVGDSIPSVELKTAEGESVNLVKSLKEKPGVIVFFRGGWCPYCNTHLAELAAIEEELKKLDVQLIAISPDKPEKLAERQSNEPLPYTLLSDSDHKAMTAFGIAFTLDDATHQRYLGYGIDVNEWSGSKERILPVPSVFVVDGKGKIKFVHTNADYKKRLSGSEILIHAQELVGR